MEKSTQKIKEFYDGEFHSYSLNKVEEMKEDLRCGLLGKLISKDSTSILVVGCGSKKDMSISNKKLVGLDLSITALKESKRLFPKNSYVNGDGCNLPFKNNSFDTIVCSEVIEHVLNPKKMILEFKRVLKNNGQLIITTPNWLSFYGLFKKAGEIILGRQILSGNQPIDNWSTPKNLRNTLKPYFKIKKMYGIWYYPPTGKRPYTLPPGLIYPLFRLFHPINNLLGVIQPNFGHVIVFDTVLEK